MIIVCLIQQNRSTASIRTLDQRLEKKSMAREKTKTGKQTHGKLVHWRDKSDTSLVEEERAEVRERPAKPRGIDSRQEVSKLPASERVDYQIDNPNPTVHAPDTIALHLVQPCQNFSCLSRRSSLADWARIWHGLAKVLGHVNRRFRASNSHRTSVYLTELPRPRLRRSGQAPNVSLRETGSWYDE